MPLIVSCRIRYTARCVYQQCVCILQVPLYRIPHTGDPIERIALAKRGLEGKYGQRSGLLGSPEPLTNYIDVSTVDDCVNVKCVGVVESVCVMLLNV